MLLVQLLGSFGTSLGVSTWYGTLNKPLWGPPNWIFAPVWTLLYLMIALSGWRAYTHIPEGKRLIPMSFWWIQLFLNGLWSWLFFALESPYYALIDLGLLTLFVALTAAGFWVWDKVASLLLLPYFFWLLFALVLNAWIYLNN